jgi:RNA polymerase sigma-70 factor, ECF subfamily
MTGCGQAAGSATSSSLRRRTVPFTHWARGRIATRMDEFSWLITREIPRLRRYARALAGDVDKADDLVQDCLERALRKRHLRPRYGSLRAWLMRMLYNIYLNDAPRRRRERKSISMEGADRQLEGHEHPEMHMKCHNIAAALDRLPAEQRAAIILIALEGLAYDEAAWTLGIPVGTLRSRLSRGRETLRILQENPPHSARLRRVK